MGSLCFFISKNKNRTVIIKKKIVAIKRARTDLEFTSLNCGDKCTKKDEKGCEFSNPESPKYKKNTTTFFIDYGPDFSIEGCPVELFQKYQFIWDFYIYLERSRNTEINLLKMDFMKSLIFVTLENDKQVVFERERKQREGGTNG